MGKFKEVPSSLHRFAYPTLPLAFNVTVGDGDTCSEFFDPPQPHLKRLAVADGVGIIQCFFNTFRASGELGPIDSQTLASSQWDICKETKE